MKMTSQARKRSEFLRVRGLRACAHMFHIQREIERERKRERERERERKSKRKAKEKQILTIVSP